MVSVYVICPYFAALCGGSSGPTYSLSEPLLYVWTSFCISAKYQPPKRRVAHSNAVEIHVPCSPPYKSADIPLSGPSTALSIHPNHVPHRNCFPRDKSARYGCLSPHIHAPLPPPPASPPLFPLLFPLTSPDKYLPLHSYHPTTALTTPLPRHLRHRRPPRRRYFHPARRHAQRRLACRPISGGTRRADRGGEV